MPARSALIACLAALMAAAALTAVTSAEPARDGAALEIQSGPVIVAVGGTAGPVSLRAQGCLRRGCPLVELRLPASAAPLQGAPGEAGRVQRLQPAVFHGGRLPAQGAGDVLGQERGVGEAACAERGEDEQAVRSGAVPDRPV